MSQHKKHNVKAKKHLGQHFLNDPAIADRTAQAVTGHEGYSQLIEIGPGTGALTRFLIDREFRLTLIELDEESIDYLKQHFPKIRNQIYFGDFLQLNPDLIFKGEPFGICGNFPYNISSQIMFKVLEHREKIPEVVGMFQHEVAERICSPSGSKKYGILSVLMQAFYETEYLFKINEESFTPPPKVKSAVIRLKRKSDYSLACDEKLFFKVVKTAFNHRRKTLRNTMKSLINDKEVLKESLFDKRPEQLDVDDFVRVTNFV